MYSNVLLSYKLIKTIVIIIIKSNAAKLQSKEVLYVSLSLPVVDLQFSNNEVFLCL